MSLTVQQNRAIDSTSIIPDELLEAYLEDKLTERPFYGMPEIEVAAEKRFQDLYQAYKNKQKKIQDDTNKTTKKAYGKF